MLPQSRLRFLLADDAGAGKTIMTGLYVREMLSRRLIRRILVVSPAGLIGNWRRELETLFSLSFRIVGGADLRSGNPFIGPESDQLIVSVDTLAGERGIARLQDPAVPPYDLVIFDEAHKLSADREQDLSIRKTDRYRLAEALVGIADDERWRLPWSCQHLLLLTATPHMGKDFPYYCLWRLLEPEQLSTLDAFNAYPPDARQRHFIRRTKEEMVRFDGSLIYPERKSDTHSYDLTQGPDGEQALYDATTKYIQYYYNRARILNRSAARLAMSVFQRRLASSTYAVLRSFERRLERLTQLIEDIQAGRISEQHLQALQQRLDVHDILSEKTADEEDIVNGQEESEVAEEYALGGVAALTLAELESERMEVRALVELARRVHDKGDESKFQRLREILRDPAYQREKFLIFTEHRDTLEFLTRRLEGLGFAGKIAHLHGGMGYQQREDQVAFFRKPLDEGGAQYLVATDAAGEGINLQFCWIMINYDVPWNPARLEQRMGRIHRYGQAHDPVIILNLVAGKTREGRVLKTLLEKLERIRRELHSDKVFDVVGQLFEGVSLRQYMEDATTERGAAEAERGIQGRLTKGQVQALEVRQRVLYGDGGDVRRELPRLNASLDHEVFCRMLPGYVRRFVEKAAPLVDIGIEGDLDGVFSLRALVPGALDYLWPALESYPAQQRSALTVYRPANREQAIFLHPGEPAFERFRSLVYTRCVRAALQGAVFVDPTASEPYFFHVALLHVVRQRDVTLRALNREEALAYRLIGLRQDSNGVIAECPVEHLLLLRGSDRVPPRALDMVARGESARQEAHTFATQVAEACAEQQRQRLQATLDERVRFIARLSISGGRAGGHAPSGT